MSVFNVRTEENIVIVEMNDESSSVNRFTKDAILELDSLLGKLFSTASYEGLIFTSTKTKNFLAGADINLFDEFTTEQKGYEGSRALQKVFSHFANSSIPTVAAIHGGCMGGGLELALACHMRVATDAPETQLSLPEVQLGILPGGGGTQRMPRLIGIVPALDLILTGKKVDGKKAYKLGLVNDVVPTNKLMPKAIELCKKNKDTYKNKNKSFFSSLKPSTGVNFQKFALEGNLVGRSIIEKKSVEQIQKNTKGFYPAPFKCLESVMRGMEMSLDEGLENEARLFGELACTSESKSLVHIFHMMTNAKKNPYSDSAQKDGRIDIILPLTRGEREVMVLGAGLMGSGISTVLAEKGVRSILIDRDNESIGRGTKAVANHFDEKLRKKRMRRFDREAAIGRVRPSTRYESGISSPVVIEAVFEDLKIKHDVLKKCEDVLSEKFIFASNTSSIPISKIAAPAKHPERVVGMHFFSPVPKMPLVEIIVTPHTSEECKSAVYDLALKMDKNIIVVNDGPGFYTTRILTFLLTEAMNILSEGGSIEDIDSSMEMFGMPVGPITLIDEVGIDVGSHIITTMSEAFGQRFQVPPELQKIMGEDRRGRKNGKGFYQYEDGKKTKVDKSIYAHFTHGEERKRFDKREIVDRCVYVFLNEAARCLDEEIIKNEMDGDMGAVFGLGFPPFLGGPFHYAKQIGHDAIFKRLEELAAQYGNRFAPAQYWRK